MNIGFFTDSYKPNTDGVVVSVTNFKNELEKKGAKVFVYAPGSRKTIAQNKDKRTRYYSSLPFPPYPQYRIAVPRGITGDVEKDEINLIHCHAITTMGFSAVRASKKLNIPLLGTFHTLIPNGVNTLTTNKFAQNIGSSIAWKAINSFYRPFPLVTTPSKTIAKLLNEHGVENTMVVPNGVNLRHFSPQSKGKQLALRKKLGLKPSDKMILVAGRQSREKNVDVVIKAYASFAKENNESKLVICGSGPALAENIALAERLGVGKKIVFTGFVSNQLLPVYYSSSDAFVTASTFETQGLTVLEAMACNTIVLGANALAIPDEVKDGKNGFLFEPNALDCEKAIAKVLNNSSEKKLRQVRGKALATAKEYSIEKSTKTLLKAYLKVL